MQCRCLQWLDKTRGQSKRKTIALPDFAPPTGIECQRTWLVDQGAVDAAQQAGFRFGISAKTAGIDIAVTETILQWNSPAPTRVASSGESVRSGGARWHCL